MKEHHSEKDQRRCVTPRFQALVLFISPKHHCFHLHPPALLSLFPLTHTNPERERKRGSRNTRSKLFNKMLLGKRPRPPMKRTTSMSEIALDLNTAASDASDQQRSAAAALDQTRFLGTPKLFRRHSSDFLDTPHFLRACSLCKRRLVPGRDIYMYRGDSAFCSLECRQQQMNQDERKEKFVMASKKQVMAPPPPSGSQVATATKGETTVVAL
ncbi:hypothetical protein VNO78_30993 [Psophocarpus tetragonolobus]|uniref:FLZ-type domain-containing protein n=1 Tax=Psophocarpus tetragonolobus TaxID=3891 RepID=A0AAN9RYF0_PSOTE